MNKKFAAVSTIVATIISLTTCSSTTVASAEQLNMKAIEIASVERSEQYSMKNFIDAAKENYKQYQLELKVMANTTKMSSTIKKLKKYANKTWYVFGGATPSGWDCSGLVLWTYEQMNVDLYHSASVQKKSGDFVKAIDAKPGDIVAFGWKGWKGAGHVGIYIGNGKMIHSPAPGRRTIIQSVKSFAKYYSKVTYTRILETN